MRFVPNALNWHQMLFANGETGAMHATCTFNNGNELTIEEPSGDITTNTWNGENRLIVVEHPDGAETNYRYNGDGLKVAEDHDGTVTLFVYDGNNRLRETDDIGTVEAEFTYIPLPYAEVLSQRRDMDSSFCLPDGIRNVRQLADDAEVVTDHYSYDAFGNLRTSFGFGTTNSQLYKGQLLSYRDDPHAGPDKETSTHFRNVNSQTGRFTSEDPAADDSNLYRYVGNNPVNAEDPSGLERKVKLNPAIQAEDAKGAEEFAAKRRLTSTSSLGSKFFAINKWFLIKATEIVPQLNPSTALSHLSYEQQTLALQAAPGLIYDSITTSQAIDDVNDMIADQRNHGETLAHWSVIRGAMREQGWDVPIATPIPNSQSGMFPPTMSLIHHPAYGQRQFEAGNPDYKSSTGELAVGLTETAVEASFMALELGASEAVISNSRRTFDFVESTEVAIKHPGPLKIVDPFDPMGTRRLLLPNGAASSLWTDRPPGIQVRKIGNHWVKRVDPDANPIMQAWGRESIRAQEAALTKLHAAGSPAANFRRLRNGALAVEDVGPTMGRGSFLDGNFWRALYRDSQIIGVPNDLKPGNYGAGYRAFDP